MTPPSPFIKINDLYEVSKRMPNGVERYVRKDAIVTVMAHPEGRRGIYSVICVKQFGFMHLAETRDEILAMIS